MKKTLFFVKKSQKNNHKRWPEIKNSIRLPSCCFTAYFSSSRMWKLNFLLRRKDNTHTSSLLDKKRYIARACSYFSIAAVSHDGLTSHMRILSQHLLFQFYQSTINLNLHASVWWIGLRIRLSENIVVRIFQCQSRKRLWYIRKATWRHYKGINIKWMWLGWNWRLHK